MFHVVRLEAVFDLHFDSLTQFLWSEVLGNPPSFWPGCYSVRDAFYDKLEGGIFICLLVPIQSRFDKLMRYRVSRLILY